MSIIFGVKIRIIYKFEGNTIVIGMKTWTGTRSGYYNKWGGSCNNICRAARIY